MMLFSIFIVDTTNEQNNFKNEKNREETKNKIFILV